MYSCTYLRYGSMACGTVPWHAVWFHSMRYGSMACGTDPWHAVRFHGTVILDLWLAMQLHTAPLESDCRLLADTAGGAQLHTWATCWLAGLWLLDCTHAGLPASGCLIVIMSVFKFSHMHNSCSIHTNSLLLFLLHAFFQGQSSPPPLFVFLLTQTDTDK